MKFFLCTSNYFFCLILLARSHFHAFSHIRAQHFWVERKFQVAQKNKQFSEHINANNEMHGSQLKIFLYFILFSGSGSHIQHILQRDDDILSSMWMRSSETAYIRLIAIEGGKIFLRSLWARQQWTPSAVWKVILWRISRWCVTHYMSERGQAIKCVALN